MTELHGPEISAAYRLLRPFDFAARYNPASGVELAQEAIRDHRWFDAIKFGGGAAVAAVASDRLEQAKRHASKLSRREIIGIGREVLVCQFTNWGEAPADLNRVHEYAVKVPTREIPERRDELARRYDIACSVLGDYATETTFGIGVSRLTKQPSSIVMYQPHVANELDPQAPQLPETGAFLERCRQLYQDHGLMVDLVGYHNVRTTDEGQLRLVDVSFVRETDTQGLLTKKTWSSPAPLLERYETFQG